MVRFPASCDGCLHGYCYMLSRLATANLAVAVVQTEEQSTTSMLATGFR
jgi:hypothetical protein